MISNTTFEHCVKTNGRVPRSITLVAKNLKYGVRPSFDNTSKKRQTLSRTFINDLAFEMDELKEHVLKAWIGWVNKAHFDKKNDVIVSLKIDVLAEQSPMISTEKIQVKFKIVLEQNTPFRNFIEPFLDLSVPIADFVDSIEIAVRYHQVQVVEITACMDRSDVEDVINTPVELFRESPVRKEWRSVLSQTFDIARTHKMAQFYFDCIEGELEGPTSNITMNNVDFISTRTYYSDSTVPKED